jgi:hypothetical protein
VAVIASSRSRLSGDLFAADIRRIAYYDDFSLSPKRYAAAQSTHMLLLRWALHQSEASGKQSNQPRRGHVALLGNW